MNMLALAINAAERAPIPDSVTLAGIDFLCARTKRRLSLTPPETEVAFARTMSEFPVATHTDEANRQHYEVPAEFFHLSLGKRLKYSSGYYATGNETLDQAEEAMLALYGERAQLADGQHILELGCGWGSLTLWMAEQYPNARITGVSNSNSQREYIQAQCQARGLHNVTILTRDVNQLELEPEQFDRCISIEMFEHMRNYARLLQRIQGWLRADGKLFVHIFAHRTLMYPFETQGDDNWMGRHFFTGGLMPAADTLLCFQQHLRLQQRWLLDGTHYERTANHWLANQDLQKDAVMAVMRQCYGAPSAALWYQRWRMFWMACAELFGYQNGQQWLVAHYLFARA